MASNLVIGSRGWQHANWEQNFYPDDLPEDWRLAYYSNEFRVVLIDDQTLLQDSSIPELWADEIHDNFQFLLEINHVTAWQQCLDKIKPIANHLAAIILSTADATDSELISMITAIQKIAPLCIDQTVLTQLDGCICDDKGENVDYGIFWRIEANPVELVPDYDGKVVVAEICLQGGIGPALMRDLIEKCLVAMQQSLVKCLIFGGEKPEIEVVRQANMMKELIV